MADADLAEASEAVAAVRRFNRFYTQTIGVLDKGYLGTDYTVAEGRVLYEIARMDGTTAKAVGEIVGLDPGYLSRIVARLERDGVVARERSAADGRSATLRLSERGAQVFGPFNQRAIAVVEDLLAPLTSAERPKLVSAMQTVEDLLGARDAASAASVVLRPHRQGDMGWIIEQNALVYGGEYNWGPSIEFQTARICADFLERFDPACEHCWVAERDGERLGCVFLVREDETTARLRLLLLTPAARGTGLGRRLAEVCITFAREAGYREVVLWTHQVLAAARKIYAGAGFVLEKTWTHDDFGHTEVSETWRLTF